MIPGGEGAELTADGWEVLRSIDFSNGAFRDLGMIAACPSVQTVETGQFIAEALGVPFTLDENLRSIDLGELAGVPSDVARDRFPESNNSMDRWRMGEIEICDVNVRAMEDPVEFYRRGLKVVAHYLSLSEMPLIVCTTSWMILFSNLQMRRGVQKGEGYRVLSVDHCELRQLCFDDANIEWLNSEFRRYAIHAHLP